MMKKIAWENLPEEWKDFLVFERGEKEGGWLIVDTEQKAAVYYDPRQKDQLEENIKRGWLFADLFPFRVEENDPILEIQGEIIYGNNTAPGPGDASHPQTQGRARGWEAPYR